MSAVTQPILWLPFAAACLHIVEEFVWPGDFAAWYRRYDPRAAASITTRFLVTMNAILLALCLVPPLTGTTAQGLTWWLTASAVCAGNALWHCYASWKTRRYSPGVVTGLFVYLPVALYGFVTFTMRRATAPGTAYQAVAIGAAYVYWSTRRRQRARRVSV
jgi:hypothetical protein